MGDHSRVKELSQTARRVRLQQFAASILLTIAINPAPTSYPTSFFNMAEETSSPALSTERTEAMDIQDHHCRKLMKQLNELKKAVKDSKQRKHELQQEIDGLVQELQSEREG